MERLLCKKNVHLAGGARATVSLCYSSVIGRLAVLLCLLLHSALGQEYFSKGNTSECKLDDLHFDYLRRQGTIAVLTIDKGACPDRAVDESYGLDSGNTPGIRISFDQLYGRLSSPWCVGIVANTLAGNLAPPVKFYHNDLTEIGSILLTQTEVNITIRDASASFRYPRRQQRFEHVRVQLCAEEDNLYFYYGCQFMGSQAFKSTGFSDSDVVGILRDLTDNTIDGYMNGVAGLYFISCSGLDVTRDNVASLQCITNPPNCSHNITRASQVVSSYVSGLRGAQMPGTSTVLLPTATPEPNFTQCVASPSETAESCDCSQQTSDSGAQTERWRNAFISALVIFSVVTIILSIALIVVCIFWLKK